MAAGIQSVVYGAAVPAEGWFAAATSWVPQEPWPPL